jgi:hypothetical protein
MAVIDGLTDIRVVVRVSHQDVTEYDDPKKGAGDEAGIQRGVRDHSPRRPGASSSEPRVITKYVECVDNAEYSIYMSVGGGYNFADPPHSLNFAVYTDGEWQKGELCRYFKANRFPWEAVSTGRIIKKGPNRFVIQPFTFQSVTTGKTLPSPLFSFPCYSYKVLLC